MSLALLYRGRASLGALAGEAPEPAAKSYAAKIVGEGLAQRLYEKAKFRRIQVSEGGVDFTLPGGAYLEAKMTATGKRLELHPIEVEQLATPSSRLVVALYNRQAAEDAGRGFCDDTDEDDSTLCKKVKGKRRAPGAVTLDDWVKVLARSMIAVIDAPGDWVAKQALWSWRKYRDAGHVSYYESTSKFAKWAAALGPLRVEIPAEFHWRANDKDVKTRPKREMLPVFVVGDVSPYFSTLAEAARRDKRMGRGAFAPERQAVPF